MASTPKMAGYNFYKQGNHGTIPQNGIRDAEVTQDMHLKMSKKIAQLTKVIYALNTKNDEHEAVVNALKEHHEKEMQQLIAETKGKVESFKSKMGGDLENKRKLEALEQCVAEHEKQKRHTLTEFDLFKKQADETEGELKTQHAQKVLALSKEVLNMKKEFEEQIAKFKAVQDSFETDKITALEELRLAHHKEKEELLRAQRLQSSDLETHRAELEKQYGEEITRLKQNSENLKLENKKNCEDYEFKLNKAQAFYEKELQALGDQQNASENEQVKLLEERYEKLKKDMNYQESQYKKRVDELLEQLSLSEEEVTKYKTELESLRNMLSSKESDSSGLSKELTNAKQELAVMVSKLKGVESELAASKERCAEQAAEMLKRSTQLGELEATRLQHEAVIRDLNAELSKVKDRLNWLENERKDLQNKSMSQAQEQGHQLNSLEKSLEDLSIEKQTLRERYDRDIKALEDKYTKEISKLKSDHEKELDELKAQHQEQVGRLTKEGEEKLASLNEELTRKLDAETSKLSKEKDAIAAEYQQMKAELTDKLNTAHEEIKRLEKIIQDSEQGLGSATSHINSLKEASAKLKAELDDVKTQLNQTLSAKQALEIELDKLKALHERKMEESRVELRTKLDDLAKDLDSKWTNTLHKECVKLREELTAQKEEDKRAALQQLAKMKDEEITAIKEGWQLKVTELLQQISMLKRNISSQESQASAELERLKRELEEENRKLTHQMLEAAGEYANKIASMETRQTEKLNKLEEQKNKEKLEMEQSLRKKHVEDMQAQMTAHKVTVETIRDQAEKTKQAELDTQIKKQMEQIDKLKQDLLTRHEQELEQHKKAHSSQLAAARMELERSMELAKQKEKEFDMKISDLKEEIERRERHISNLDEDAKKLQQGVSHLSKELDAKGKEILKIRSEATQSIRKREEQLARQHKSEIDHLNQDHLSETQQMLAEFNRAQDLLKDKISALQIMLEEAEDRYRNRESRPEDLDLIRRLQEALEEREVQMKKLIDDKKFFQLELMNRETNFNKVFTGDPKVGLMNPLIKPRKKGSAPSLGTFGGPPTRLQPLPNSPNHEERLNPHKTLPPAQAHFGVKKFVS